VRVVGAAVVWVGEPPARVKYRMDNPQGLYYGGTIAAPVAKEIFENILPYLDK